MGLYITVYRRLNIVKNPELDEDGYPVNDGEQWKPAESYLDGVTDEQEAELEEKMNEVLNEWLDKHGHEVNFYSVTNEEEVSSSN